jgi:DNA topoisomerase-1
MSAKNLVIVESPAKAKKIAPYLGSDFQTAASLGHVRDLPKKGMSIDIEHNFKPTYEVSPEKQKTIRELKKLAKGAETVWLASDPDREGEAIAWHLYEALGLKPEETKRIVFYEITEGAIKDAIKHPRQVDQHLVDAQQARRVLDRLVGYELSPVLWRKVRPGLSAGRVQSVAVRLIVEREREIEAFQATSSFRVVVNFKLADGTILQAELPRRLKDAAEAEAFLKNLSGSQFSIQNLETKPAKRSPAPPFTTSTLQQEAARKLSFSVRQTMVVAQKLYEEGLITYMRTDSVNLSDTALVGANAQITKAYGPDYAQRRTYKTKTAGAQEAHEAIRPTDFSRTSAAGDRGAARLYELIWQRAIASQMAEAQLERSVATISISASQETLTARGEMIKFDGFLKVYREDSDEDEAADEKLLPPLKIGQPLQLQTAEAKQTFDRPKPRYTEASLVKKLEEMGIGRPSTYAPTISTIQDRGYVEKGEKEGEERQLTIVQLTDGQIKSLQETERTGADRGKLIPTSTGEVVTDFLVKHFSQIIDYDFTAKAEEEFDKIAEGQEAWNAMIAEFYGPFHSTVKEAENVSRMEATQGRELGNDPKTGKPVWARFGRYGPMVQLGEAEDEEKPTFAPIPEDQSLDSITLEEALELLTLPRTVGRTPDGQDITANFGRFGPYIKFGSTFVSIKPDDPFSITLERALQLIEEKKQADASKNIQVFESTGVKVLNGRFGPYVTDGTKNARIPKDLDPHKLTLAQCQELLAKAPSRGKRRGSSRAAKSA